MNITPTRERCSVCLRVSPVDFSVGNETWERVVPTKLLNSCLCLDCFINLADEKLVFWDRDIKFWPVSWAAHLQDTVGLPVEEFVERWRRWRTEDSVPHPVTGENR